MDRAALLGENPSMPARSDSTITINRAAVLTLWAAVVAERLGYAWDEALTFGRAVAGLNAAAKARWLGISERGGKSATARKAPKPPKPRAPIEIELCGRIVPAVRTGEGLRAVSDGRPTSPESVERYLEGKFGDSLEEVRVAMKTLARSRTKEQLAAECFALYESFRPKIPSGTRGWGAKGALDPAQIRALAEDRDRR
jgi:hypothetical protein